MLTVRATTALPIGAHEAFALALKPATFAYVARGVMRVPALEAIPGDFAAPGAEGHGRMWWLGVIPAWTHHLRIVAIEDHTIQTAERGGPLRTWNHRLSFVPTAGGCEYTDEIEIDAGALTRPTALFTRAFFALRQARWRRLAAVLA
ncbi:hypothetical protein [Baekduia sp. Peel2402]|uniref:hypothetical protein n=1 Tax=Baekduia sp. Peel2402 TaxID=3458296 RepID=UPI00403EE5D7